MSTVADVINDIQYRVDSNASLVYLFNRAVRIISKRLFLMDSKIIQGLFTITPYASVEYAAATIAFVNGAPDTITDSASQFVAEGFTAGMYVYTDDTDNPGPYKIDTVAVGTLTLTSDNELTNASAGTTVTITSASEYADLPSDFWSLIDRPWDNTTRKSLAPLPNNEIRLEYISPGQLTYYEVINQKLYFVPSVNADNTVKGYYYQRPTALSTTASTLPWYELFDDAIGELVVFLYKHSDTKQTLGALESFMLQNVDPIAAKFGKRAPKIPKLGIDWGF